MSPQSRAVRGLIQPRHSRFDPVLAELKFLIRFFFIFRHRKNKRPRPGDRLDLIRLAFLSADLPDHKIRSLFTPGKYCFL